jgi:hypothetical protein
MVLAQKKKPSWQRQEGPRQFTFFTVSVVADPSDPIVKL